MNDRADIFSLRARRELAREEAHAHCEAEAHAKCVGARISSERRVAEILELVAHAERSILVRLAPRDFMNFLAQAKAAIARLVGEDRPVAFESADEVARSLKNVHAEATVQEPAPLCRVEHHGSNGFGAREG